jgi:hypothetical protein
MAEAEAKPSNTPGGLSEHGRFLGRFIFQKSATNAAAVQNVADAVFANAGVTAHANLTGLTAQDHPASAITILDTAADFTATDVEGALAELQADNEAHAALTKHAGAFVWMEIARWYLDGLLRADTSVHQGPIIQLPPWAATALLVEGSSFKANVRTTSAGAAVIIDITIASTIAGAQTSLFAGGTPDYPSIAAASYDASADDGTLTTTAITGSYFLRMFVRQVGSTAESEGEDLTVQLLAKVYIE